MASYFLSDVHLKPLGDKRTEALCHFLEKLENVDNLFLLGDIFDFWMGGHQIWQSRYARFVGAIKKIQNQGAKVYFFEGNHDIHIHPFWEKQLGVKVFTDPQILDLYGLKVRIEHGDVFNPDDAGYIFLRKFLRSGFMKHLSINAPGTLVAGIADWGSATSHKYSSKRGRNPEVIADIKRRTKLYVESSALKSDFDLLIMGHTHVREDYTFEVSGRKIQYVNLGSWFESPAKVFVLDKGKQSYIDINY